LSIALNNTSSFSFHFKRLLLTRGFPSSLLKSAVSYTILSHVSTSTFLLARSSQQLQDNNRSALPHSLSFLFPPNLKNVVIQQVSRQGHPQKVCAP
jgi:hypothetical protein